MGEPVKPTRERLRGFYLGLFDSKSDALYAYAMAARKLHGTFARFS